MCVFARARAHVHVYECVSVCVCACVCVCVCVCVSTGPLCEYDFLHTEEEKKIFHPPLFECPQTDIEKSFITRSKKESNTTL